MAEILHYKKSMPKKIKANWPVTIYRRGKIIEAESQTVTDEGLFIYCEEQLPRNETFRIIIIPTPKHTTVVRGKLIFSNPGRTHSEVTFSNKSLSFVKVSKEDSHLLHNLIQRMEKKSVEIVKNVKMKLEIETNKKLLVKDFRNLHDLRLFMQDFYSMAGIPDRRANRSLLTYTGPERRMQI